MFSNIAEPLIKNVAMGNITFGIPGLLPQFFFLLDCFSNDYTYKKNAEVYDWSRNNKNSFLDDFNLTNWNSVMEIEKNDVNISFNNYLSKVNSLIRPLLVESSIIVIFYVIFLMRYAVIMNY